MVEYFLRHYPEDCTKNIFQRVDLLDMELKLQSLNIKLRFMRNIS
jgi:hypothetical protein